MTENGQRPVQSTNEVELPPSELKTTVTQQENYFRDAFERSLKLPGWSQVPGSVRLYKYEHQNSSGGVKWNITDGEGVLQIKRQTSHPVFRQIVSIMIVNNDKTTILAAEKITLSLKNPGEISYWESRNLNFNVDMLKRLTNKLPQDSDK